MDDIGKDRMSLSYRHKRYIIGNCRSKHPDLRNFLFSDTMASICRSTLGENAYLVNEQYAIKGASNGMRFGWHQDAGYIGNPDNETYLSCWCALDDMTEKNGTIYIMPFSHIGIRSFVKHTADEHSNDQVGYHGNEKGVPVIAPAGSIAVFTSLNFHRSGENQTPQLRSAYLAQYSKSTLCRRNSKQMWGAYEPILVDGKKI